ncbi:MAG TPA: cytochrome b/b6 domain-containing protein [Desulfomonilaceae bacterium]|nr:cytochrome b/b6 domain-containing protein [Desulfomonilaceae bacterium]
MADQTMGQQIFWRFSVIHRALHLIVIFGFIGIVVTGFSMAFSSVAPARGFASFLGGADSVRYLHRFFAVVLYLCVVTHVFWLFYYKFILGGNLLGPNSVCFRKQDLLCLRDHIGYILAFRNAPPAFDRFTYWEKVDYWAIFIGMQSMGLTGLFLWFPEFFSRLLPGYFVNVAHVLHFDEAVLAVLYIFLIHLTNAHWRPGVYPGDWTIFTGKTTKETLMKDHPGEWASLNASPQSSAIGEK